MHKHLALLTTSISFADVVSMQNHATNIEPIYNLLLVPPHFKSGCHDGPWSLPRKINFCTRSSGVSSSKMSTCDPGQSRLIRRASNSLPTSKFPTRWSIVRAVGTKIHKCHKNAHLYRYMLVFMKSRCFYCYFLKIRRKIILKESHIIYRMDLWKSNRIERTFCIVLLKIKA